MNPEKHTNLYSFIIPRPHLFKKKRRRRTVYFLNAVRGHSFVGASENIGGD
jgi:hypothetical protein